MKKTSIILGLVASSLFASAQVRISLFEEFTGENCPPCASTNPALNVTLNNNSTKVIALKWQVPIPSAPSATWSLYKTNQAEIDWRYRSTGAGGYGYPAQDTPTNGITSGVNSAPSGRLDGQHQWAFGLTSDHPFYISAVGINSAQAQPTNFSIVMTPSWSPSFTSAAVSVSITSSTSFTSVGAMMFRLCLVERVINFATAPGTNGEKDFEDVVRKSYPTTITGTAVTAMGTAINNTWTAGQTQTFVVNCVIPNYINDLSQMAFVGFVQDDGNRKVYNAARTSQPSIPNDIKVVSVAAPVSCTGTFIPSFTAKNQGTTAITAMTVVPYVDGAAQATFTWTGSLAAGATTAITLGSYTATYGSHTFSTSVTGVSGGDVNTANNSGKGVFGISNTTSTNVAEPFATFPPAGWYVLNYDYGSAQWGAGATGGFGASASSAKYDFYNNGNTGDKDDLYFPAMNLTGVNAPVLSFQVAYTQYSNENDILDVMVSTNCGTSWTNVFTKQGASLSTAPTTTANFVPSPTQWRTENVSLPSLANQASVLVKFVATTDYGNNMYIDNINLGAPTSISQYENNLVSFELYPNPASTSATIKAYSANDQKATVVIYNALGQVVKNTNVSMVFGTNEINVNTSELNSGIYNVVLNTENGSLVKKLTVTK